MDTVRGEIIDKCCGLFVRYGTKSITMDDLARELGMSKKTIYQHFSDKEEVVMAFVTEHIKQQIKSIDEIAEKAENVIDELMRSAEHMKMMMANMNPSLVFDLKKYHPKCWMIYLDFKKGHLEHFIRKTLEKGILEGFFRKDIDTKILARLRVETVEVCFSTEQFPSTDFNLADVQLEALTQFMYGISTLKGHKLINKYKQITEDE
jgi:TetR/AcrR family transcriptional regulator, cholesterol catabolism regulator